ncbi:carbon-nitrogen hydrolase family protein [Streptomyces sp. Je 1-4]|uniref:carbon-nitrogen hydrolase family protein n=1 Tax=Streptomyces TaxID=1883 RepID=UPI00140EE6A3|nr:MULTISPECIES: carbon-nitrogen hydrolase family protein [unclassified Streptomyces]QIK10122.1 carbon-nitrogen hydrolase family protein [Streptomyces sp. ID38640]UYB43874.1 carbon-nitrogen hydrolase family protein [Streptomyces sp. Je 1-4]UZQ40294.1 carbon-nitrogen hydrolase family protein [Streptomyces sp. Je 1-4] [Streptomyces sp. Je 1-4 4N24]UZQ47711.1 carbon-nitrogen hydrolase family protein [Streptomyces sp. Je 1-4] [Streptomyces sp. Je 1-4 4N24_ara]
MKIACLQTVCGATDVGQTLDRLRDAAGKAAAEGAELLVAPEMTVGGYPLQYAALAQSAGPAEGPQCAAVSEIAREAGIAVAHGWPERDGARLYNAVRLVGRDGRQLAVYRKAHLYGRAEQELFTPGGSGVVQASLGGLTVGMLICYDVEFPEAVRAHALAGTDLLLVPTGLMSPWDFVAQTIVPARAFESQLYIAYANWSGEHGGLRFCGRTTIAAPDGTVECLGPTASGGDQLLFGEADPNTLASARRTTPYLRDRRPELYGS